jgi:hypothetical protein
MATDQRSDTTRPPESKSPSDRRLGPDRRKRPTPVLSRHWLVGRRRGGRRIGEATNIYVDKYTIFEWLLVIAIFVLCLSDLVLTIMHISAGAQEANPIMGFAWREGGNLGFSLTKMGITIGCLFVLLIHIRFRPVPFLCGFVFLLYAGVFVYHRIFPLVLVME